MKVKLENCAFLAGTFRQVSSSVLGYLRQGKGFVLVPCSLNDLASIHERPTLQKIYSQVDICTTDGMPLVWWFNWKFKQRVERVYGPDLMASILKGAQGKRYQHLFFGSTNETLKKLQSRLKNLAPKLNLATLKELPFRALTKTEENKLLKLVGQQTRPIIWLSLSSPKQVELAIAWKKRVPKAAIFCVGAAFDFLAGEKKQAPKFMQQSGLEWLWRLVTEPRRLGRRYLLTIPRYLLSRLRPAQPER